ncbi:MAG: SDR family NAD(P)-dependent oxidoreductase [Blastococcus sp.]
MTTVDSAVVLVTGGGGGIGRATAVHLGAQRSAVVVSDVDEVSGSQTAQMVEEAGGRSVFVHHDVTSETAWERAVGTATDAFGSPTGLFNCAGLYAISSLGDLTVEVWDRLMAVNVTGTFLGMRYVAPAMREGGGGSIVNASSIAAMSGSPGHILYGASKGAVRAMTKHAAAELSPWNIRVNSVHPGYTRTAMAAHGAEIAGKTLDDLGRDISLLGRLAAPEEVAALVSYLLSEQSAYVTAAEFVIDGGASATIRV